MDSSDVYKLALSRTYRYWVFAVMAGMSLIGLWLIIGALRHPPQGPPRFVVVLWCGALIWNWNVLLRIPFEIRFEAADAISFVALARTTQLRATDIGSIKLYGGGGEFYVLRHTSGKIRLVAQFTGFHEVISRLKAANPQLEVVGI